MVDEPLPLCAALELPVPVGAPDVLPAEVLARPPDEVASEVAALDERPAELPDAALVPAAALPLAPPGDAPPGCGASQPTATAAAHKPIANAFMIESSVLGPRSMTFAALPTTDVMEGSRRK